MKLYFKRHDGQAVTCDDFVNVMADANNCDLAYLKDGMLNQVRQVLRLQKTTMQKIKFIV